LKPIAEQHAKALKVNAEVPIIVCLGNPPYDRHEAADETNKSRTGHWVRWGDDGTGAEAILAAFTEPAKLAGHGGHLKNLYNLYVYFWRWALWKVFEAKTAAGPGVASFISASSYLEGDAFCGMREHMRRLCDEIWILDLGGDSRGTRKSENVFAIQTPVAVAVAVRYGQARTDEPARVRYAAILNGTRDEKLHALDAITDFASLAWQDGPDDWQAPFRPAGTGTYSTWPALMDLLPWQHSGVQFKRKWPIGPTSATLKARWQGLLSASDRGEAFRETDQRKVSNSCQPLSGTQPEKPIAQLPRKAPAPRIERYAYRSFDRQWILADSRLGDRMRPDLWAAHSEGQVYLTSLLTKPLGTGPALTACAAMPDLDHFSGRGAKDIVPLYRDAARTEANITPGLLEVLATTYGQKVTAPKVLAYIYGALAHPAFTALFADELATRGIRVPLTKDAGLFAQVASLGEKLLWLHTYGQRFVPKGKHAGQVPKGSAKCQTAVPPGAADYPESFGYNIAAKILRVGAGEFGPVMPEMYEFEVSGLKVLQSWLGYRMKMPKGKKSSPLDDITTATLGGLWPSEFTTELLELLWVLEATLAEYPKMAKLLSAVAASPCFVADELPVVPDNARKPPGSYSLFPE
jgi:hypothetical protein